MREAFLARQIGATVDVLAEEMDRERNELSGRAGNYAEVRFPGNAEEIGEIHRVVVETVGGRKLSGKRIE